MQGRAMGERLPRHEILIPSFGIGNLSAIGRMAERSGGRSRIVEDPADLRDAQKIVLAGVGAFDQGMAALSSGGWRDALEDAVRVRRIPILGICLGMQMLCKASEEGHAPGLGWIDAEVVRVGSPSVAKLRVPHMGWNTLRIARDNPLLPVTEAEQRFYFAHSYRVICEDPRDPIALTDYGSEFVAAFARDNLFGVQFHPEKSHRFGMELFRRFLEL